MCILWTNLHVQNNEIENFRLLWLWKLMWFCYVFRCFILHVMQCVLLLSVMTSYSMETSTQIFGQQVALSGMHPERGLSAFPHNILRDLSFCNHLWPNVSHLTGYGINTWQNTLHGYKICRVSCFCSVLSDIFLFSPITWQ